jgi:hypothetical protein
MRLAHVAYPLNSGIPRAFFELKESTGFPNQRGSDLASLSMQIVMLVRCRKQAAGSVRRPSVGRFRSWWSCSMNNIPSIDQRRRMLGKRGAQESRKNKPETAQGRSRPLEAVFARIK